MEHVDVRRQYAKSLRSEEILGNAVHIKLGRS